MKPVTVSPDLGQRIADVLDYGARVAISLGAVKLFLSGIYKPLVTWRREHTAKTIREVLAPELSQLQAIIEDESGCAGQMKDVLAQMRHIFVDLDLFLDVAHDNRDRQDETNELLDEVFGIERLVDPKRRKEVEEMLQVLADRRKARRRVLIVLDEPEPGTG